MSKIYRYIWILGGYGGEVHGPPYICHSLFKQMEKAQEHNLYFNQILHHFDLKKKILGWIIKFLQKGSQAQLLFLYEVSIVVLIDFIAIFPTPGIFLIQIVNTNNTNMYLIHFHSKNIIKMHFPQSFFLKFQNHYKHSLSNATWWNKLRWHQQRFHNRLSL